MKAIFCESSNGYLARNESDTMEWTGSLDKQMFKLLTTIGGVCVCSKHTYSLLPQKMLQGSRQFIVAERTGKNSLVELNKIYPYAYLIGGPAFLSAAYKLGVIDMFIVTTVAQDIQSTEKYKNPFTTILKNPACKLVLDTVSIKVYNKGR